MVSHTERVAAAGLPARMLGLRSAAYRRVDIWRILEHYNIQPREYSIRHYTRLELLVMLNDLVTSRGLGNQVRHDIRNRCAPAIALNLPRLAGNETASSEPSIHTVSTSQGPPSTTISRNRGVIRHYRNRSRERRAQHRRTNDITLTARPSGETTPDTSTDQAASTTISDSDTITPECIAFLETLTIATTPNRRVTEACNHEPSICLTCLGQSIVSQIDSKIWNQIDCPTCKARLSYDDIKAFATEPVFER